MSKTDEITILWWNTGDFYHYDHDKKQLDRWPKTPEEYKEKCTAIDAAFNALFKTNGKPTIITLGEITAKAAKDLKDRLFPEYKLISLDTQPSNPTLQIAILHRESNSILKFSEAPPIVVPATPKGTRPMGVLDISIENSYIRCITCHWQARLDDSSGKIRNRLADHLSQYVYDFLSNEFKIKKNKSVIIIGDLNDEPFGESAQEYLNAHRHKNRSKNVHWADDYVKRVHLYNCSWRLLGEKNPHPLPSTNNYLTIAGTYYWEKNKSWHNLDNIIVSSGLLGEKAPYINEEKFEIISLPEFMPDGLPKKFTENNGKFSGLSDHLPIVASISI